MADEVDCTAGAEPGIATEDPFAEFLAQEEPGVVQGSASAPPAADIHAQILQGLLESSQRQEQMLGKVCSVLLELDEKMGRIAANQSQLESTIQHLGVSPGAAAASSATAEAPRASRGQIVLPPGRGGSAASAPISAASNAAALPSRKEEEERLRAERLAQERALIEAENQRRAEELKRRKEEEERRRLEELERQRIEEERRKAEERLRKEQLQKNTSGLMDSLITGSDGGLFGDDPVPKSKKKGGLFDD
mmetsp:Transcript_34686/g.80969  ORF Transcript_34686/g.80969 Transcript_34686/m.80969 type:complete len:250 (-) Transcript_34686:106-855(-)